MKKKIRQPERNSVFQENLTIKQTYYVMSEDQIFLAVIFFQKTVACKCVIPHSLTEI